MPVPRTTTSDMRLSFVGRLEGEGHDVALRVLANVGREAKFQPYGQSIDVAVDGRQHPQTVRQLYQSQSEGHEWLRSPVIARRLVANHREAPQHAAVAQRYLAHRIPT